MVCLFPCCVSVMVLAARTSDHNPVYVQYSEQSEERQAYKRGFKFEDSWFTDAECSSIITSTWDTNILGGTSMQDVQRRYSACQQDLSRWSWRKFGNAGEQLKKKTKQLKYSSAGSARPLQDPAGMEECLRYVDSWVMEEINENLLRPFTEAEVSFSLSQMHPLKSHGPDGFAACFYQKSWATVGKVVSRAVLQYLNGGAFDSDINATNIVLIPKVPYPSRLTEYRLISLYNVLYKLIAKVMAN